MYCPQIVDYGTHWSVSERIGAHLERIGAHLEHIGTNHHVFGTLLERIGAHLERIWSVSERIGAHWSVLVNIKIITITFFKIIWMHNH